jgi:hypothetical protein
VRVVLHPEVSTQIVVNVAQSLDEAKVQAAGRDPRAETARQEAEEAAAEAAVDAEEEIDA